MAREITSIGVVGLGTMGAGIAEVAARHGIAVVGVEQDDDAVARARRHVEGSTDRAVQRGKITADEQAAGTLAAEMKAALDHGRGGGEGWRVRKSGERFWASGEMMKGWPSCRSRPCARNRASASVPPPAA